VMRYRDYNDGEPIFHTLTLGRDQIQHHMYLLLKSQTMDDEGFSSVQFNLPAMPRLLVDVARFNEMYYREHFLELITSGLSSLEAMSPAKVVEAEAPEDEEEWVCDDCTERLRKEAENAEKERAARRLRRSQRLCERNLRDNRARCNKDY